MTDSERDDIQAKALLRLHKARTQLAMTALGMPDSEIIG